MAIALFAPITATGSPDVRARAFAGQGLALAQQTLLFGVPAEKCRPQALSCAKAALLAQPTLSEAHLAFALALKSGSEPGAREAAQSEVELALEQDQKASWCWAELARLLFEQGELPTAQQAAEIALKLDPNWLFALEIAAELALRQGEADLALKCLEKAGENYPHCAHIRMTWALALRQINRQDEADVKRDEALKIANLERHRTFLEGLWQ